MSSERPIRSSQLLLVGVLTIVSFALACVYCLGTWSQPNRSPMLTLYVAGVGSGAYLVVLARRLAVATRFRRIVMVTLTVASVLVVSVCAYLDGGAVSPTVMGFLAPMVFVAITARPRQQVYLQGFMVAAYLTVAAFGEPPRPGYLFLHVSTMAVVVVSCVAQGQLVVRQRAELRAIARIDPLTGALNRRGLHELAASMEQPVSVVCVDFDDFKSVNDRLGHAAGDELLRWSVAAMRLTLGRHELIARLGGDEFLIVLPAADSATAAAAAERLVTALAPRTGASAGTATAPLDGETLEELTKRADQRLYEIKRGRRRRRGEKQAAV
ncbi:GGDEF domain-containing protein [Micromonospora sp. NPDC049679]|uniref:GGDEF domain-containing protein n=1 Tax=Micromonospora sp. NPDC049679 TaxID=3155920 RepID=UPI0033C821AB